MKNATFARFNRFAVLILSYGEHTCRVRYCGIDGARRFGIGSFEVMTKHLKEF